jgi:hypothetical protein
VGMNSSLHDRIDDVIRMQWPPELEDRRPKLEADQVVLPHQECC